MAKSRLRQKSITGSAARRVLAIMKVDESNFSGNDSDLQAAYEDAGAGVFVFAKDGSCTSMEWNEQEIIYSYRNGAKEITNEKRLDRKTGHVTSLERDWDEAGKRFFGDLRPAPLRIEEQTLKAILERSMKDLENEITPLTVTFFFRPGRSDKNLRSMHEGEYDRAIISRDWEDEHISLKIPSIELKKLKL